MGDPTVHAPNQPHLGHLCPMVKLQILFYCWTPRPNSIPKTARHDKQDSEVAHPLKEQNQR